MDYYNRASSLLPHDNASATIGFGLLVGCKCIMQLLPLCLLITSGSCLFQFEVYMKNVFYVLIDFPVVL